MGSSGLEPPTSRLSGARSNQLSYEPLVFVFRLEPPTSYSVRDSRLASLPLAILLRSLAFRLASSASGGASASALSGARSNQLSYEPPAGRPGGDERVRTDGLLRARQALSHLSYTPMLTLFPI